MTSSELAGAERFRPAVTVAAVVERDGRYLLVEEVVHGRRVLNQPAGHLEAGETLLEAVVRETLEETGWVVAPTALVAVYQWTSPADARPILRFTFAAEAVRVVEDAALDHGIERVWWLDEAELATHPIPARSPLVARSIADHRRGLRVPLEHVAAIPPAG